MTLDIPAWCECARGTSTVLLVAPHGGRRPLVDAVSPPPGLRVNDLYTPEVTRLLGQRLGASTIINHGQDRNTLDLNRASQVEREAPWFFALLAGEVGAILDRHGHAEVLFIHGWNVGQPCCDLGIGGVESDATLQIPADAALSVSGEYRTGRLGRLRAEMTAAGIATTLGVKYPASHRNNVVQVFSHRGRTRHDPAARQLAAWASQGLVDAVQLELGIPLRWPGRWRTCFVDAVVGAFQPIEAPAPRVRRRAIPPPAMAPLRSSNLQLFDAATGIGLLAGIGPTAPGAIGGRLLLFLGGQRVALFTGESDGDGGLHVEPLRIWRHADGFSLGFNGPMLVLDDAAIYLDLEAAMAESRLEEAAVELSFTGMRGDGAGHFGMVSGSVKIEGTCRSIVAGGFANAGSLRPGGLRGHTVLTADFGGGQGLLSRCADGDGSVALHYMGDRTHSLLEPELTVTPGADPYIPSRIELRSADCPPIDGRPVSRMAVLRSLGGPRYVRVTFGAARFEWAGQEGWGLYEHAVPLHGPGPSNERPAR